MTLDHSFKLERNGPTACLHVRRPTNEELENIDIIDITDEHEWQPYQENLDRGICNVSIINTNIVHDEIDDWLLNSHNRRLCALQVTKPKDKLTPEYLAQLWKCGIDTARKTIDATTCKHYRNTVQGMTKRYRPTRNFMRYKQIRLPAGEFYTDTMIAKIRSIRGHTCAQIYGNKFGYIKAYPLNKHDKQNLGDSLSLIIQDVGVMQKLHTDNAPEMVGRKTPFFARARKEGIDLTTNEPLRPDENYGEILVKKAKITSSKIMVRRNVPLRLWCYALEYACDLSSMMVPPMYRNNGRSGYEIVHGHTPDISEYVEFEFYEYCWYWDTPQSYPHEKKQLGRWLGIAHRVGQSMVFWIMNVNGKVIGRSTVSPLDPSEIRAELEHLHLETGQPSFSFTNRFFDTHPTLLTHSWAVETWRFMQLHAITIDLNLPQFRLRRLHDTFLMPALLNSSIPKTQWKQFNKCRLYLNVISLADLSSGDGMYLRDNILNGIFDRGTSRNSIKWPARQRPPSSSWTVWNACLLQLFCTGTTGRLVTRLGEWYQQDVCNQWEWHIHLDSSTLLQTYDGTIRLFKKQGRSRLSPKFSTAPVPVTDFDLTHYLRTTISRTSNYIHSHGSANFDKCTPTNTQVQTFNWLHFKVVRTPSIELLLHDMILHKAFAVTDGSYHPFDENGAAAWTIESSNGTEYISGISLIPGDFSLQSAIRSELIGILAIFSYMQKLIDEFALHNVGGILGCDCRSALESTFHSYRPPKVSDHHADIKASIHHFVKARNISLRPMHIYAHQDDFVPFHQLSIPEQKNVRMDFLAKQARIDYSVLIQNTSLSISIPFSFAPVRVRGHLISDNIKKELLHHISFNIATSYWIDKGMLTKDNSSLVFFNAISKASSLSRLSMRIFISKWASGHLGTGKVVVRNNYRLEGSCPFCLYPNEDTAHILDCQHGESLKMSSYKVT
jgi:hypothetical protein